MYESRLLCVKIVKIIENPRVLRDEKKESIFWDMWSMYNISMIERLQK